MSYTCDDCHDTGWVGDNGPGRGGNSEYHECHCSFIPKNKYPFEKVREFLVSLTTSNVMINDFNNLRIERILITDAAIELIEEINAAERQTPKGLL